MSAPSKSQRGGFVMGVVIGLLVGLALALGVALYITKAPVPFVNKVPQRTAEQDTAEAERNRTWDPNAPLGGKPRPAMAGAASAVAPAVSPAPDAAPPAVAQPSPVPARDPAAILSGQPVPTAPVPPAPKPAAQAFDYFVQAGAFSRTEDAEQQRAKLAMMGSTAKISEREQAGRMIYRVRVGPYPSREDADNQLAKLQEQGVEAQIVRVEKP